MNMWKRWKEKMNVLKLKIAKLWVLLISQMRLDVKAYFAFWGNYVWILFVCVIYRFLFEAALSRSTIFLSGYYISFPLFLMSGIALYRLVIYPVVAVDETILNLRRSGVMSWILVTPTSIYELFFVRSIWRSFLGITEVATVVFFAHFLVGIPIKPFFQVPVFFALIWLSLAYISVGMLISAASIWLRRGSFLCTFIQQISYAFGGVFFPIYLFPKIIGFIPLILPLSHVLNIVRYVLVHGGQTVPFSLFLPIIQMTLIYFVIGSFFLQKSLVFARQNGLLLMDLHE